MKFYNIKKSRAFFEKLNTCEGQIDIIGNDGSITPFGSGLCCIDGTITQIELRFQNTEDLDRMLHFALNEPSPMAMTFIMGIECHISGKHSHRLQSLRISGCLPLLSSMYAVPILPFRSSIFQLLISSY